MREIQLYNDKIYEKALKGDTIIDHRSSLEECRNMVVAFEGRSRQFTSPQKAEDLLYLIKNCYPNGSPVDNDFYSRIITDILMEYDEDIARKAVDNLTRKCKFLPTRAEVASECESIVTHVRKQYIEADYRLKQEEDRKKRHEEELEEKKDREFYQFCADKGYPSIFEIFKDAETYNNLRNEFEKEEGR